MIMERARCMGLHAGLPLQFWADGVNTAIYLINRGPSSALDGGIPQEAWIVKQVKYSFLRTFGCEAFVHIDKDDETKLEAKSKKCTFIGQGLMILVITYGIMKITNHQEQRCSIQRKCHTQTSVVGKERGKGKHNTQYLMK